MELKKMITVPRKLLIPVMILTSIVLWGLLDITGLVVGIVLVVFAVILNLKLYGPSIEDLVLKKSQLQEEINIAERKFLQHKIDSKSFTEIRNNAQEKMIAIDAAIQTKKIEVKIDEYASAQIKSLNKRRRSKMLQLLKEKGTYKRALKLAESKYYQRKIDSESYKRIVAEQQKKMIQIESKMAIILREQAKEIMSDAEKKLAMSEEEFHQKISGDMATELYDQTVPQKMRKKIRRYIDED